MKTLLVLAAALAAIAPGLPAFAQDPVAAIETTDRFSVEVRGDGPDVILIPGLLSPRSVWDGIAAQLEPDYRLHLVEVAGFGDTPAGANSDGDILPHLVDGIAAYIERERIEQPAVIGHSMGGFTGLSLALNHPDLVGKLMIVDSLPFFSVLMDPVATTDSIEPQAAVMRQMMAAGQDVDRPSIDCAKPSMQAIGMSLSSEGQCKVDRYTASANLVVGGQLMYEIMTTDLRPRLPEVRVPVTMLYPHAAPLTEARAASLYGGQYDALPGVRLVAIPDARHFIMFDQPERFAEEVGLFLSN